MWIQPVSLTKITLQIPLWTVFYSVLDNVWHNWCRIYNSLILCLPRSLSLGAYVFLVYLCLCVLVYVSVCDCVYNICEQINKWRTFPLLFLTSQCLPWSYCLPFSQSLSLALSLLTTLRLSLYLSLYLWDWFSFCPTLGTQKQKIPS